MAFDGLFPGRGVRCLFANPAFDPDWSERALAAFGTAGTNVHLVRDSVGLIVQRVLGHIVNIASGGAITPYEGFALYGAAKAAVIQFSKVLALEEVKNGIVVNVVSPGPMLTWSRWSTA